MLRQYSPLQDFDFQDEHLSANDVPPENFIITRIREYTKLLLEITDPVKSNDSDELLIKRIEHIGKILESLKRALEAQILIENAPARNNVVNK